MFISPWRASKGDKDGVGVGYITLDCSYQRRKGVMAAGTVERALTQRRLHPHRRPIQKRRGRSDSYASHRI